MRSKSISLKGIAKVGNILKYPKGLYKIYKMPWIVYL
jgi:hypothetical protein